MLEKSLGIVLRRLRAKKGLSQEAFGFEVNLHRTYISQLERGLKSPSLNTLSRICRTLKVTISELLLIVEREEKKGDVLFSV